MDTGQIKSERTVMLKLAVVRSTKLPVEAKKHIFMVGDTLTRDFKAKQTYTS